jgi:hypothetical protein
VPDSALDITKIPTWVSGDFFEDFEYVVEAVVFGFAEGFINQNNYVLARLYPGAGTPTIDNTSNLELGMVDVVLPSPAPTVCTPYEVYSRTVYQGDPYMTRDGSTLQAADYTARYGQIPVAIASTASGVVFPQYVSGVSNVERPNSRAVEVLATMDFFTTLGTGKVGGVAYPNTMTDCGYTTPTQPGGTARLPGPADYPWVILPRTYTEGQNDNSSFAKLNLQVLDWEEVRDQDLAIQFDIQRSSTSSLTVTLTEGIEYTAATSNEVTATVIATAINTAINGLTPYVYAQAIGSMVYMTM